MFRRFEGRAWWVPTTVTVVGPRPQRTTAEKFFLLLFRVRILGRGSTVDKHRPRHLHVSLHVSRVPVIDGRSPSPGRGRCRRRPRAVARADPGCISGFSDADCGDFTSRDRQAALEASFARLVRRHTHRHPRTPTSLSHSPHPEPSHTSHRPPRGHPHPTHTRGRAPARVRHTPRGSGSVSVGSGQDSTPAGTLTVPPVTRVEYGVLPDGLVCGRGLVDGGVRAGLTVVEPGPHGPLGGHEGDSSPAG